MQELEQQLATGQPISKAANPVGSSDLQAVVAKLTHQEACAALYNSAKEHIGDRKVRAVCEAMVHVYFFRGEAYENGKDWLDTFGSGEHTLLTVLDTSCIQELELSGFAAIGATDVALRLSANVANLAGIDSADVSVLLWKYQTLFSWELKQHGFLLRSTTGFYMHNKAYLASTRSLVAWQLEAVTV